MLKEYKISNEALEVLKNGVFVDNIYYLPHVKVERSLYNEIDTVLKCLGGKWNRSIQGHVFESDVLNAFNSMIEKGTIIDWKKTNEYFPTPNILVNEMMGLVNYYRKDKIVFLEPSAGTGGIADSFKVNFPEASINCVEINPMFCCELLKKEYNVINDDFLNVKPFPVDVIIMNPPFSYETEHIKHAFEFLKIGGQLISITSYSILSKNNKKNKDFKLWFENNWGYDYPIGNLDYSFKDSGTNVKVKMLVMEKYEELYG